MKKTKRLSTMLGLTLLCFTGYAQTTRVLFLGNSYTAVNNLPSLTQEVAESAGYTLEVASNTPGGYTLEGHSTNAISLELIAEGSWDFVVLQEQSQRPSFPYAQVVNDVFPYATQLDESILAANACAETVFYMTWGREEGDAGNCANWPPVCTYEGMDDLLRERYLEMAEMNNALVSPVGAVWRYLRENNPDIELYATDGSHPSPEGSYAAACSFFVTLFRVSPALISFDNNLDADVAATIRNAAKTVVYDQLDAWFIGTYDLSADFESTHLDGLTFEFTASDQTGVSHFWDFGNSTSIDENPIVTFPAEAQFDVTHTIYGMCDTVSITVPFYANPNNLLEKHFQESIFVFPNPVARQLNFSISLSNALLELYTIDGKLVKSIANFNGMVFNVIDLPNGPYILRTKEQDGKRTTYHKIYICN